ncbi:hypothetical protein HDA32_002274 [Spinactinospora alkalitolerans]|uniref:Uncharacterized protein n=1 Tax=Spinactinospora alkalitolerans TaxID=687207 RepID=A0A852TYU5_9ACTN|nr:hypothetical protein [Spinactinospora alkalitolerans]
MGIRTATLLAAVVTAAVFRKRLARLATRLGHGTTVRMVTPAGTE